MSNKGQNYYVYNTTDELGNEPLGTEGNHVFTDTTLKLVKRVIKTWGFNKYSIYSFTNFYDDKTFKLIERNNGTDIQTETN